MAVVYWRSSSGALSFRSNVSMATTTLDTWLGLSGRNRQLRTESRAPAAPRQAPLNVPPTAEGRVQRDSTAPVLHQPPHRRLNMRFHLAGGSQQPPSWSITDVGDFSTSNCSTFMRSVSRL